MLHSRPEARTMLLSYLQQLRGKRHPGPLEPKLARVFPALEETLFQHIIGLENGLDRIHVPAPPRR
jgi:hypothetical protein